MAAIDVTAVVADIAAQAAPIASISGAVLLVAWVLPFGYRMLRKAVGDETVSYSSDGFDPLDDPDNIENYACPECGEVGSLSFDDDDDMHCSACGEKLST